MGLGYRGPPSPVRSEEAGFGIALSRIYGGHQLYAYRGTCPPMVRGLTRGILLRRGDRLIPVGRVLRCASPWGQRRRRHGSLGGRMRGSIASSRHSIAFVCVHRVVCRLCCVPPGVACVPMVLRLWIAGQDLSGRCSEMPFAPLSQRSSRDQVNHERVLRVLPRRA